MPSQKCTNQWHQRQEPRFVVPTIVIAWLPLAMANGTCCTWLILWNPSKHWLELCFQPSYHKHFLPTVTGVIPIATVELTKLRPGALLGAMTILPPKSTTSPRGCGNPNAQPNSKLFPVYSLMTGKILKICLKDITHTNGGSRCICVPGGSLKLVIIFSQTAPSAGAAGPQLTFTFAPSSPLDNMVSQARESFNKPLFREALS